MDPMFYDIVLIYAKEKGREKKVNGIVGGRRYLLLLLYFFILTI